VERALEKMDCFSVPILKVLQLANLRVIICSRPITGNEKKKSSMADC
jgi:hypothetical protein